MEAQARSRVAARPVARSASRRVHPRVLLLGLGGLCLLAGLDAALVSLGLWAPVQAAHLPDVHGMVMVLGFMGSVISLERAQALRQPWAYLAPGVLACGALALVLDAHLLGQLLLVQGCGVFLLVYVALWRRAPLPLVAVQVLSAVLAAMAALLWLAVDVASLLPLLAGFLVLTIISERAELAQLTMGHRAVPILVICASGLAASASLSLVWPEPAVRFFGGMMVLTAVWLIRDDVVRRMIRTSGLRRYNATALLLGYGWLIVAGVTWLVGGPATHHAGYDVTIHATFLGFGVSMIMAHAPIIFPTVIGRDLPYRPVLWAPLVLLNMGLLARVPGAVLGMTRLWEVGSVLNIVAMLTFVVTAAVVVVRG